MHALQEDAIRVPPGLLSEQRFASARRQSRLPLLGFFFLRTPLLVLLLL